MSSNPDVPPFTGYVETTVNALRLIHAARQGVIPRITRRLNDSERRSMIKSGAVFVFSVEESGIKRWTDGLLWSPSRIVGNFLVYREINERTSSRAGHKKPYPGEDSPTRVLTRKCSPDQVSLGFKTHGGSDQGTFKVGGLIKKTITVTIEGSDLHLISYYTSEDIRSGRLKKPSTRTDIMNLYMPPHIFRLANFRVPPKMETGPDGKPRLVETEDVDAVDCKVEDQGYNIPSSPTWSSQTSPTSPVDNSFPGSSLYSLGSGQGAGHGNGYSRAQERWSGQGSDCLLAHNRQDLGWNAATNTLSSASGHSLSRRRDGSLLQSSENWSPITNQHSSGRWQGGVHETTTSSTNTIYQERTNRVRSIAHPYDEAQLNHHRDSENGLQTSYTSSRYPAPTGTREGALQRLHWHTRDAPENVRDLQRRSTTQGTNSFSPSPPMPYSSQGYHSTPTYTSSWTSSEAGLLTTPTLHPVSQPAITYDGNYTAAATNGISAAEEYANVEDYQDS